LGEGENFFSREKKFSPSPKPSPLFKKSEVFCRSACPAIARRATADCRGGKEQNTTLPVVPEARRKAQKPAAQGAISRSYPGVLQAIRAGSKKNTAVRRNPTTTLPVVPEARRKAQKPAAQGAISRRYPVVLSRRR